MYNMKVYSIDIQYYTNLQYSIIYIISTSMQCQRSVLNLLSVYLCVCLSGLITL